MVWPIAHVDIVAKPRVLGHGCDYFFTLFLPMCLVLLFFFYSVSSSTDVCY